MLSASLAIIVVLAGFATRSAGQTPRVFEPEVEIQTADYAKIRRDFRTTLLRHGPSPQHDSVSKPPEGVVEVEFPSGALHLKAWMSGQQRRGPKLPAVLFLHGGFAFGLADWEMALPYWEAGFVVMVPMLRGENGLPGDFSMFYDEVDDVLAAARYLSKQPSVDASRIYIAGHSAGGTLTLLAVEASGRFRAAAAFDGSPDQQLLYNGSASKPGVHQEVVFDAKDLRELRVRSPLAYATSFKSPVRLYYSTEASSLLGRSILKTVDVAKARGLDAEAIQVEGSHMSHVAPAMQQSIAFFKQSLGARSARLLKHRTIPPLKPSLVGNTTFTLKGYPNARIVTLAGTFNSWDSRHALCGRVEDSWVCRIDLAPGKYLYKFVVDDDWILDPDNPIREDDGTGNTNSVIVK